jgi:hypothetical protein
MLKKVFILLQLMCIVRQVNESDKYHHLPQYTGPVPIRKFLFVIMVVVVVIAVILVVMACGASGGGGGGPYTKSYVIVSI